MINVSEEWIKNQQKLFTSESHIRVTISDDLDDLTPTVDNESHTWLSLSDTIQDVFTSNTQPNRNLGTLELNRWILDGNVETPKSESHHQGAGLIIDGSPIPGGLRTNQIDFDSVIPKNVRSLTITFDVAQQEYARDFDIVIWYVEEGVLQVRRVSIRNNTVVSRVVNVGDILINVGDIQTKEVGIIVEVLKWTVPNRRVRVSNIHLGFRQVWTNKEIFRYRYKGRNSPILTRLPSETVTVEINDIGRLYNPLNPDGNFNLLAQRQQMTVEYGFTINNIVEWVDGGMWYLDSWESVRNLRVLRLSARDVMVHLEESLFSDFHGRQSPPIQAPAVNSITAHGTLTLVARELRERHGLDLEVDPTIQQIAGAFIQTIKPYNRQPMLRGLHQACVSIGVSLKRTSDGNLRAFVLREHSNGHRITRLNQFTKPEVLCIDEVNSFETNIYRAEERRRWTEWEFRPNPDRWESVNRPIAKININDQTAIFTTTLHFDNPSSIQRGNHIANIRTPQGGLIEQVTLNDANPRVRIIDSLVGRMTVEVDLSSLQNVGSVEFFGFDFDASFDNLITNQIQQSANGAGLNIIVENNEFIVNETRARTMFDSMARWLKRRNTLTIDCRIDPRIALLDNIDIETEFGTKRMTVTKLEIDYSGSYTGRVSGVLQKED